MESSPSSSKRQPYKSLDPVSNSFSTAISVDDQRQSPSKDTNLNEAKPTEATEVVHKGLLCKRLTGTAAVVPTAGGQQLIELQDLEAQFEAVYDSLLDSAIKHSSAVTDAVAAESTSEARNSEQGHLNEAGVGEDPQGLLTAMPKADKLTALVDFDASVNTDCRERCKVGSRNNKGLLLLKARTL
ncbi:hypothetical protein SprV_0100084200 [Sparganum proliferum]